MMSSAVYGMEVTIEGSLLTDPLNTTLVGQYKSTSNGTTKMINFQIEKQV